MLWLYSVVVAAADVSVYSIHGATQRALHVSTAVCQLGSNSDDLIVYITTLPSVPSSVPSYLQIPPSSSSTFSLLIFVLTPSSANTVAFTEHRYGFKSMLN